MPGDFQIFQNEHQHFAASAANTSAVGSVSRMKTSPQATYPPKTKIFINSASNEPND
jgi:DNA uptake protein ComE-like DNA-binding protein